MVEIPVGNTERLHGVVLKLDVGSIVKIEMVASEVFPHISRFVSGFGAGRNVEGGLGQVNIIKDVTWHSQWIIPFYGKRGQA